MRQRKMTHRFLRIQVGSRAAECLAREGWHPNLFTQMLGASGGPKWLMLAALDQVLHRHLLESRTTVLDLVGSSIGAWRHACLVQQDVPAAIRRFLDVYTEQQYGERPTPAQVSAVATEMLHHVIDEQGLDRLVAHPQLKTHIVTVRGKGIAASGGGFGVPLGMGTAALANLCHRSALQLFFQRVVFSSQAAALPEGLTGFASQQVQIHQRNVIQALKASGAIPMVLEPQREIHGAPPGFYWDGGIVDYHFEVPRHPEGGLILYPHFADRLTPGWFDKFIPWRSRRRPQGERLVLISPSRELVASLPYGKIPERSDFKTMSAPERRRYWRTCIDAGQRMADVFEALVTGSDPLMGVEQLP